MLWFLVGGNEMPTVTPLPSPLSPSLMCATCGIPGHRHPSWQSCKATKVGTCMKILLSAGSRTAGRSGSWFGFVFKLRGLLEFQCGRTSIERGSISHSSRAPPGVPTPRSLAFCTLIHILLYGTQAQSRPPFCFF